MLDVIVKYSSEVGLSVNMKKTECMAVSKTTEETINLSIHSETVKQVDSFVI